MNYWKEFGKFMQNKKFFLLGMIIACQFILFLLLKLYFFENIIMESGINSSNSNSGTTGNSNATPIASEIIPGN